MSSLIEDLDDIKGLENDLVGNKVANFAYEDSAYTNNQVNGVDDYNVSRAQNIPNANASILKVNATVLAKGLRSQASSITRMLVNHFFGRVSYNLNKIHDNFSSFLTSLRGYIGQPNGIASLDADGRIPYSQLPESALEWKGEWDASTNTPHLADGTGTSGDMYIVTVAGTQDLGSGDISFLVNDRVIYNGTVWQRFAGGDVRTVSEIPPDTNGNVDLSLQTDITKVLAPNIIAKLFGKDMALKWKSTEHSNTFALTDIIGSTPYGEDLLVYGARGLFLLESDFSCSQLFAGNVVACTVINSTVVIATWGLSLQSSAQSNKKASLYYSDDLENWIEETINATNFTNVEEITTLYTANGLCLMGTSQTGTSDKYMYWSTDGKTWTAGSSFGTIANIRVIEFQFNNNLWLAVASVLGATASNSTRIWSSTDGKTWTARQSLSNAYSNVTYNMYTMRNTIYYKDGVWLWFAPQNTYTSTNGTSWTEKKISSKSIYLPSFFQKTQCITCVNGTYYFLIYVTATGHYLIKTDDLQTFTTLYDFNVTVTGAGVPTLIMYLPASESFIAVDTFSSTSSILPATIGGKIWTSEDGDTWVESADVNNFYLEKIVPNNLFNGIPMVVKDGYLCTTEDFETWNNINCKLKYAPVMNTFDFKGKKVGGTFTFSDYTQCYYGVNTSGTYPNSAGHYILSITQLLAFNWVTSGISFFLGETLDNKNWVSDLSLSGKGFFQIMCAHSENTIILCTYNYAYNALGREINFPKKRRILKTTDLQHWETIPESSLMPTEIPTDNAFGGVFYVDGKFFISVSSGNDYNFIGTFVSSDEGTTWTHIDDTFMTIQIRKFNNLYIRTGQASSSNSVPQWSEDGLNWTDAVVSPAVTSATNFVVIDNLLIGYRQGSTSSFIWSEDGKNWTRCTMNFSGTVNAVGIEKVNGIYFAYGYTLCYSLDGKTWNKCTSDTSTSGANINRVAYGGGLYVGVSSGNSLPYWSSDGIDWVTCTMTLQDDEMTNCVMYKNGVWIIGTTKRKYRSLDGKTFDAVNEKSITTSLRYTDEWLALGSPMQYSGIDEIE